MILAIAPEDIEGSDWSDPALCAVARCIERTTKFRNVRVGWRFLKLPDRLPIELSPRLQRWIRDGAAGKRVRPYREEIKVE